MKLCSSAMANVTSRWSLATCKTFLRQNWVAEETKKGTRVSSSRHWSNNQSNFQMKVQTFCQYSESTDSPFTRRNHGSKGKTPKLSTRLTGSLLEAEVYIVENDTQRSLGVFCVLVAPIHFSNKRCALVFIKLLKICWCWILALMKRTRRNRTNQLIRSTMQHPWTILFERSFR